MSEPRVNSPPPSLELGSWEWDLYCRHSERGTRPAMFPGPRLRGCEFTFGTELPEFWGRGRSEEPGGLAQLSTSSREPEIQPQAGASCGLQLLTWSCKMSSTAHKDLCGRDAGSSRIIKPSPIQLGRGTRCWNSEAQKENGRTHRFTSLGRLRLAASTNHNVRGAGPVVGGWDLAATAQQTLVTRRASDGGHVKRGTRPAESPCSQSLWACDFASGIVLP